MERIVLLSRGREILADDLPHTVREGMSKRLSPHRGEPIRTLEELEREQIEIVLSLESNQEKAASLLGITTVTLWRKRKQFGLP